MNWVPTAVMSDGPEAGDAAHQLADAEGDAGGDDTGERTLRGRDRRTDRRAGDGRACRAGAPSTTAMAERYARTVAASSQRRETDRETLPVAPVGPAGHRAYCRPA